ncbi:MAG: hypothetical protein HWQ35_27800 [Nostoc sp. NMS1]|nr:MULTISPECIES: hypothetical protein [unclassified Nostoc]MBN3910209.1 hypothetical protein [Nostoc sp. NMS1]MBN3991006.1 hypothetical protein [Nostoc sp. NMS2]
MTTVDIAVCRSAKINILTHPTATKTSQVFPTPAAIAHFDKKPWVNQSH